MSLGHFTRSLLEKFKIASLYNVPKYTQGSLTTKNGQLLHNCTISVFVIYCCIINSPKLND